MLTITLEYSAVAPFVALVIVPFVVFLVLRYNKGRGSRKVTQQL